MLSYISSHCKLGPTPKLHPKQQMLIVKKSTSDEETLICFRELIIACKVFPFLENLLIELRSFFIFLSFIRKW